MKIIRSKETLILTQVEKAILSKAFAILDNIYNEYKTDGDVKYYALEAKENIENLLEDTEVENGEPKGEINVTRII